MNRIVLVVQMDRMGCITAEPISQVWCQKYRRHMQEMTGRATSQAFFQGDYEAPDTITTHRNYKDLLAGWDLQITIDPWEFGHWLGYDACNVTERGKRQ